MPKKTLSLIETQRVIAILDDTLEKLAFLGSITPDVLAHRDELSQFVGDEISRIIEEQRELERRYEELIAQRGALKGLSNKSKYKANQAEIQEVSRALRESTKNLCRNLKENPNVSGNLLKIQNERGKLQDLLAQTVRELQDHGTCNNLLYHVEGEKCEQDRLTEIIEKEKLTTNAVAQLEQDLQKEKVEREREVKDRQKTIAKLKEELHNVKSKAAVKTNYARKEAEAKSSSTLRHYQQSEREVLDQIEKLKKRMALEEQVHKETLSFLTRKQEQLTDEVQSWNDKYAEHLDKIENDIHKLNRKREKDLERLDTLQARWDQDLAEQAEREAEIRRIQEEEEYAKELAIKKEESAIRIQMLYRNFRKYNAPTGKKGKAKGGKGKKGKKGKK